MPTILKTKNSVTTTVVPTTLQQGELAVNITDKKLWVGNAATTPVQLLGAGVTGDVVGPASATDNAVARFDATTGKLIQNSLVTVSDTGAISAPVDASISGLTVGKGLGSESSNTAVGGGALGSNTSGNTNSAFGFYSLISNTTGSSNSSYGYTAMLNNTTGANNVAYGHSALISNTTASNNTAVGFQAAYSATTSGENTAIGYQALYTNSTSGDNVAVGRNALRLSTAAGNTAIGEGGGSAITTGAKNTILGRYTGNQGGLDIRTADNYIVLSDGDGNPRGYFDNSGMFAVINASTGNAKVYASSSTVSYASDHYQSLSFTAAGTGWNHFVGYASIGSTLSVKIQGNGNLQNANNSYGAISDIKLKENIVDASPKLDKLMQVKIRNYNLKGDYEQHKQLGVVAQELEQVFPSLVDESIDKDKDGNDLGTTTKSVKYSVFVPMLIKAVQELNAKVEAQALEIATLKGK
jgi:hypothetical protein